MMEQPDLFEARAARDDAFRKLEDKSAGWSIEARARICRFPRGWEGTGEELRLKLASEGLPKPHHHNAWGALIHHCIKSGFLHRTGKQGRMATKTSHARATQILRRT